MNKSKQREQEYGDYSKNLAIELPAEAVEVLSNGKNAYIHMNGIVYRVIEEKKYWEALSQNRKAILEEVRSKVIGKDSIITKARKKLGLDVLDIEKNFLRAEQRQKLSLLEGETK